MTAISVGFVDVYPFRVGTFGLELLALKRSPSKSRAGAWEAVHGHLDGDETPFAGAVRELSEETSLEATAWYNLSRTEAIYLHRSNEVVMVPAFAALLPPDGSIVLSDEHDASRWVPAAEAGLVFVWPRERRAIDDLIALLGPSGHAGLLESELRIVSEASGRPVIR